MKLCVYCGSRLGLDPVHREMAVEFGELMVENRMTLVYGGGRVGLMGVIADTVMGNGGSVHGIIPESLFAKEVAHESLTELEFVQTLHQRKARMEEVSDGFIVLPGGFGTMDEFFEILTWRQLNIHQKPIAILNSNHFYDPLIEMMQKMKKQGFVDADHHRLLWIEDSPLKLIARFLQA